MLKWYEEKGNHNDVVLSTEVLLSRNLKKYSYSPKISDEESRMLVDEVEDKCKEMKEEISSMMVFNLSEMSELNQLALAERHIISSNLAKKKQCKGLLMKENESAGIMINGEDHIKIQAVSSGMCGKEVYQRANQIDDLLSEKLEMAFDEKYGYLTTSPTNIGTGMKISNVLFLPALAASGKITRLVSEIGRYGLALKSLFGDNIQGDITIFQVYNQKTLGNSEKDVIDNLQDVIGQIIRQERIHREYAFSRNYNTIEDQMYRSYGILKYARQLDCKEAVILLSQVMLGICGGMIETEERCNIYSIILNIQPYILQSRFGKNTGSSVRDRLRAEYIKNVLPNLKM